MIEKQDIESALHKLGDVEHFRKLCFRHRDPRMRAGFQAIMLKRAMGFEGDLTPTESEMRSVPAGQLIPADEVAQTGTIGNPGCKSGRCTVRGPQGFADEDLP